MQAPNDENPTPAPASALSPPPPPPQLQLVAPQLPPPMIGGASSTAFMALNLLPYWQQWHQQQQQQQLIMLLQQAQQAQHAQQQLQLHRHLQQPPAAMLPAMVPTSAPASALAGAEAGAMAGLPSSAGTAATAVQGRGGRPQANADVARMLAAAADAVAAKGYQAGSGPLHVQLPDGRLVTIADRLPGSMNVRQLLPSWPVQQTGSDGGSSSSSLTPSSCRPPLLAFHNSLASRAHKFLRPQLPSLEFHRGSLDGPLVTLHVKYNPPGPVDGRCVPTDEPGLSIMTDSYACTIQLHPSEGDGAAAFEAQARVHRQLVVRQQPPAPGHKPYWRRLDRDGHVRGYVGCVALYAFPGERLPADAEDALPLLLPASPSMPTATGPLGAAPVVAAARGSGPPPSLPDLLAGPLISGDAANHGPLAPSSPSWPYAPGDTSDLGQLMLQPDAELGIEPDDDGAAAGAEELDLPQLPQLSEHVQHSLPSPADCQRKLNQQLLMVAAGVHGDRSGAKLSEVFEQVHKHNQRSPGYAVSITGAREYWFLERSMLHLLVSEVRVWGIDAEQRPDGLSDAVRCELLDALAAQLTASDLQALMGAGNRNRAVPFFTAAHFGNPAAVGWLLALPPNVLTLRLMCSSTKRGKLAWHISSTQAALAAARGDKAGHARLTDTLRMMLEAFANRLEAVQKLKEGKAAWQASLARAELWVQQRAQRSQQRQREEAGVAASGSSSPVGGKRTAMQVPQPAPAAADQLVGSQTAAAAADGPQLPARTNSCRWSRDVLWLLKHYYLFHSSWPPCGKPAPHASPPYDGSALHSVARELFRFEVQWRE